MTSLALLLLLLVECESRPMAATRRSSREDGDGLAFQAAVKRTREASADQRRQTPEHLLSRLPNRKKKRVARELKCSICVATVNELWDSLAEARFKRFGKRASAHRLKAWESEAAIGNVCRVFVHAYGLQLEKNQFTHRYSKNTAIARQVGEWVNSFAEEHCGDLMEEQETLVATIEALMAPDVKTEALGGAALLEHKRKRHIEAVAAICEDGPGTCKEKDRGRLGAWDGSLDAPQPFYEFAQEADAGDAKAQRDTEASLARQAAAEVEAATFEELARYQGPRSEL